MISDRYTLPIPVPQARDDTSLLQITELIADTLGIHIQPQQQTSFRQIIQARIRALKLSSFQDYYQYLQVGKQSLSNATEWQALIPLLTVNESYFFRDQGQFWLLRNRLLPELIQHKRQLHLNNPSCASKLALRLWSAGCSTGEEAYSLAILVRELLPDYRDWEILILGTDINQTAIQLARQGIYSDWSFRMIDPAIQSHYFELHSKGWKIASKIQAMVSFQPGNLLRDPYPDTASKIHDLDLILCRNVFIYFNFDAIATVLDKFHRSLFPGGMLLTGHTELHGQKNELFQVKKFSQSVIYQKPIDSSTKLATSPLYPSHRSNNQSITISQTHQNESQITGVPHSHHQAATEQFSFKQAHSSLTQKVELDTIHPSEQPATQALKQFQTYCLIAETQANLGQYAEANQACQQALKMNPLAIEPYYLLAQIAEEQGDIEGAKLFLKRIIYLIPTSISAYLELGSIYEHERNVKQAQKTWRSLLEILQYLPPEHAIDVNHQQTLAELKHHLLKRLGMETG